MRKILLATALSVVATIGAAEGMVTYSSPDSYDDVVFGLESAILDAGLVIDSVNHVGDMLERTGPDVGSDVVIFENAEVYSFCSATLSRKVMEEDPMNLMFCPYTVFVARLPGADETIVGYRGYPEGPMKEVEAMLDGFAREAAGLE